MDGPGGPAQPGGWPGTEPGRFESFRPDDKPPAEDLPEPTPQIRNGRVLLAVLAGAALLLIVPFAIVWALTKPGGGDSGFEVGSCVKQSGSNAVTAQCSDEGAFEVVSKVAKESDCPDPKQPAVVQQEQEGTNRVLCLKPAAK